MLVLAMSRERDSSVFTQRKIFNGFLIMIIYDFISCMVNICFKGKLI